MDIGALVQAVKRSLGSWFSRAFTALKKVEQMAAQPVEQVIFAPIWFALEWLIAVDTLKKKLPDCGRCRPLTTERETGAAIIKGHLLTRASKTQS